MPDRESLLNLQQDEGEVARLLAGHGGALDSAEAGTGVYWATMSPRSASAERYYARIAWDSYPFEAPSVKFGDGLRGPLTLTRAWPLVPGYRAESFDICKPMTKEGFGLHPEWAAGSTAWVSDGNPFLWVVQTMQFHLDNEYQGRAP